MIPVMTNIFQYLKLTRTIQTKSDPLLSEWEFDLSFMGLVTPMILNDKESRNVLGSLLTQGLKENIDQKGNRVGGKIATGGRSELTQEPCDDS